MYDLSPQIAAPHPSSKLKLQAPHHTCIASLNLHLNPVGRSTHSLVRSHDSDYRSPFQLRLLHSKQHSRSPRISNPPLPLHRIHPPWQHQQPSPSSSHRTTPSPPSSPSNPTSQRAPRNCNPGPPSSKATAATTASSSSRSSTRSPPRSSQTPRSPARSPCATRKPC